jgi:hypothetical protein
MKNIREYLSKDGKQSSMRLMAVRISNTAAFIAIVVVVGCVIGLLLCVYFNRGFSKIAEIIRNLLGGTAGIIGTLLIPAFGGKAAQTKFEISDKNKGGNL